MNAHDEFIELLKSKELIEKVSPKFNELTLDIQQVFEHSKNPLLFGALLFKLAEERDKTNKLLEQLNDKYDKIMFELKTKTLGESVDQTPRIEQKLAVGANKIVLLPEQDQKILRLIEEKGPSSAEAVQSMLSYKGKNAACQRLNKLSREGLLRKIQSGKKVLFFVQK
ncbi:MAG: hypothetical protein AB1467_02455 [Candidatus Diapherotrites archaeon]